jgi:hypothetical protein
MKLGTDRANLGNARDRKLLGEHPRSLLMQRVFPRNSRNAVWVCRRLSAADDHHQQLIRADKRNRRPRAHRGPDRTVPRLHRTLTPEQETSTIDVPIRIQINWNRLAHLIRQ